MKIQILFRHAAAVLAVLCISGCASSSNGSRDPRDPLEPVNRAIFRFNDVVDDNVAKPVARTYVRFVPELLRDGVANFFSNLEDIYIGANNLLQGKFYEGASDAMRVVMNTVFGLGGILDVASTAQLEKHNEDFGQTLGRWGVGPGPYLVLPLAGPSNVRDAVGLGVSYFVNPIEPIGRWAFPAGHRVLITRSLYVLYTINLRAQLLTAGDLVDAAAVDRYSFVRNAYLQRRRSLIYDGNPPVESLDDGGGAAAADRFDPDVVCLSAVLCVAVNDVAAQEMQDASAGGHDTGVSHEVHARMPVPSSVASERADTGEDAPAIPQFDTKEP